MTERPAETAEPEDRLGMTEEQWARFQAYTHGFGEQDEFGIDISLLRENLRLTPKQRVERLFRSLALFRSDNMDDLQTTLRTLLAALHYGGVRCLLIGGVAMRCHGSAYITDDVDFCFARDSANLAHLAEALAPLHPRLGGVPVDLPFRWDSRTLKAGQKFTLATDAGDVDLLGDVPGAAPFDLMWQRSSEIILSGIPVRVVSLDDLIAMKRAAGRDKDLLYLRELERLRTLLEEGKG
jgi:predicted nucleotidyltransferase